MERCSESEKNLIDVLASTWLEQFKFKLREGEKKVQAIVNTTSSVDVSYCLLGLGRISWYYVLVNFFVFAFMSFSYVDIRDQPR